MRDLLYSPFRQSFTIISFQDTFLNLLIKDVQVAASGKSRTHLNSYYAALALYHRFYDPLCMKKDYHRISIKDLYPNLSEEELRTAEENLDQYLEVVLRIYERILSDPEAYSKMERLLGERSNKHQHSDRLK